MKRIILILLLLACMMGTANAAYWKVNATSANTGVGDFFVIFNDADGNNEVTADDIVSFSGVSLTTNYSGTQFYNKIFDLTNIKIDELQLLTLKSNYNYWVFYDTSYGYPSFRKDNWNCSAELTSAPTPIPGAAWLLGTGIMGLYGLRRKFL